jgi:hypothetical protein
MNHYLTRLLWGRYANWEVLIPISSQGDIEGLKRCRWTLERDT